MIPMNPSVLREDRRSVDGKKDWQVVAVVLANVCPRQ